MLEGIKEYSALDSPHPSEFYTHVLVSDIVSLYGTVSRVGRSSITININVYIERKQFDYAVIDKVAEAEFVYVRIDDEGNPIPIT